MTYIPHGISSGQIGHNSDIDLSDTPGSTNGKFIGFGEDGTSAIANRAHWFLSQNIDHVYQEVHRDIAVPKRYDRTAGAGEVSFQFPAGETIWVGDTTYPGVAGTSDPEGMQMLFNVVDSNYNELTDGAGNEVRVKLVRESTGVTDVYQDGFHSEPIIYFVTVDPATGAEVAYPHTITLGTDYKVLCGIQSTVAEMPADSLMRFKTQSSSELEAGVFLQDGTRPMTADINLDGNDIVGFTGLSSLVTTSLQDTLNAGVEAQEALVGNRVMDRTGSITTSGADVTYPALKVVLQGQVFDITGSTVSAPASTDTYYLYITAAGVVTLSNDATWGDGVATPTAGSVLIWKGDFTSGPDTWANTVDLRWPNNRRGNHVSIFVGSGVGADFVSLNQAVDWANYSLLGVVKQNTNYEIVVVGEVEAATTIAIPAGWTLRGLSRKGQSGITNSLIKTSSGFTAGSHVISTGANCTIKDLEIKWDSSTVDQSATYAGLSISYGCVVEGVQFIKGSYKFANNISIADTGDRSGPIIRDCYCDKFVTSGIVAEGYGRVRVENCTFVTDTTATYHIDFAANGAADDATGPGHIISGCFFNGIATTANILVGGPNVLVDSCQGKLSTGGTFIVVASGHASQEKAGVTARNCLLEDGSIFVTCAINNANIQLTVLLEGCTIRDFDDTIFNFSSTSIHAASHTTIRGCDISAQTGGYIGYFTNIRALNFVHNRIVDGGTGIYVGGATQAVIDGNYIDGWDSEAAVEFVNGGTGYGRVVNNYIKYSGSTANTIGIKAYCDHISIENNDLIGDGSNAAVGISISSSSYTNIANNRISNWSLHCVNIYALVDARSVVALAGRSQQQQQQ